jgi:acyl-CoA synthetase (NDP forming)
MQVIQREAEAKDQLEIVRLLRPRSIALVGASSKPGSLSETVLENLERAEYSGTLHLIHPKRPVIRGRQCLGAVEELPVGVDCAVLAIPGAGVLASVRACAERRVGSVIVFSAGFAEAGEQGRAEQRELNRIARESGMVLEGPNCLGMVNYVDRIPLTFVVTPPQKSCDARGAAILSQSGALAAVIAVNMRHYRIPLTYSVSTGNEASTGIEDFLEYLLDDASTRVFALVVEQFRQPRRFLQLAKRARAAGKIIVLLHPGRSQAARASAATHTGAITGSYDVMHTLVTNAGVIHVDSMEELVDVTQILVLCKSLPQGGAAVFTESGAFKALTLDLCERVGLDLPKLSPQAESALRLALPAFIPPSNPLDLTAQGLVDPTLYRRTLPAVLDDDSFGSVVLAIILTDPQTTRLKLPPILDALRTLQPLKPVLFSALDEGAPFDFSEIEELRSMGVACFPSPERAIRALAHVTTARPIEEDGCKQPNVDAAINNLPAGMLPEYMSKALLATIGIPIPAGRLARSAEEAVEIARELGFPVVLKAQSSELGHKTEAGGVALGLETADAVLKAWSVVHTNVLKHRPGLCLEGMLVERMGSKGVELIVGARNDVQWGPVLLVGLGGIWAEAIQDVCLMAPNRSPRAIVRDLLQLRGSALLRGYRGVPEADLEAVADVVARLGKLMVEVPEITEVDINPLVVYPKGSGVVALDALIVVAKKDEWPA